MGTACVTRSRSGIGVPGDTPVGRSLAHDLILHRTERPKTTLRARLPVGGLVGAADAGDLSVLGSAGLRGWCGSSDEVRRRWCALQAAVAGETPTFFSVSEGGLEPPFPVKGTSTSS